jgi:hypothetical protein
LRLHAGNDQERDIDEGVWILIPISTVTELKMRGAGRGRKRLDTR